MDSLACKKCGQISSVTPCTRQVRCHGCNTLVEVGSPSNKAWTTDQHSIRCQPKSSPSRIRREWSLELQKKKSEAKNLYHSFRKRCSNCSFQQNQTWSQPPYIRTMDIPAPRGKRAIICGVSYKAQENMELKGTAQDVKNMEKLLLQVYSFPREAILILAEEGPYMLPTKKNIEDSFRWLVGGIQPGDSLVFYFSGHGKRQRDHQRDEIDGFDETICPMDFEENGMISITLIESVAMYQGEMGGQ